MESKYKERAKELFTEIVNSIPDKDEEGESNGVVKLFIATASSYTIQAMCQLAEEIYNEFITLHTLSKLFYSKEQVEELLQKQRELCAEKVKLVYNSTEFLQQAGIQGQSRFFISKDSILNAKLKID